MVKNIYGGNKHKSQGRKFTVKVSHKLRTADVEGELYAIVTKMLGSGMFYCHCIDNTVRLCHIRGKFSGRGKRDNIVELGKWVLVGEREWESKEKADKKCDLLEVYNDLDKEKLMDTVSMNWSILNAQDVKQEKETSGSSFEFTSERDEEMYKMMDELKANKTAAIDIVTEDNWIDDI
jgi:initiation factor 1A